MHTVSSLLNGRPASDAPGGVRTIANPANLSEAVAEARLGDATTFVEARSLAHDAQAAWASVPAPVRGRAIQQLGRLVEDNAEALARLITREIGKPLKEARGEVQEVVDTCNFFLSEGRRLYGMTVPTDFGVPEPSPGREGTHRGRRQAEGHEPPARTKIGAGVRAFRMARASAHQPAALHAAGVLPWGA